MNFSHNGKCRQCLKTQALSAIRTFKKLVKNRIDLNKKMQETDFISVNDTKTQEQLSAIRQNYKSVGI